MPLEYSWGSLELLPLNILLVQVVVLLTHVSSSLERKIICEKLLVEEQQQSKGKQCLALL